MSLVSTLAAVAVGVAFVVAGASKFAAGAAWPTQARGLGAPEWSIAIVPPLELVLGAVLVSGLVVRPAAIAAAVLLAVFSVLIVGLLRQGRRPPCACFGAWSATPIGPAHLVRNAVLLVLAVLAAL